METILLSVAAFTAAGMAATILNEVCEALHEARLDENLAMLNSVFGPPIFYTDPAFSAKLDDEFCAAVLKLA